MVPLKKITKKKIILIFLAATVVVLVSRTVFESNKIRSLPGVDMLFTRLTCYGTNQKFITFGTAMNYACVRTYPDEGKSCSSSAECLSGLCVRAQHVQKPYCRGFDKDLPLCFSRPPEATVEGIARHDRAQTGDKIKLSIFVACD